MRKKKKNNWITELFLSFTFWAFAQNDSISKTKLLPKSIYFTLLFFSQINSYAQVTLKSQVVNHQGEPIPYAHIYISKRIGTISNIDGFFELIIPREEKNRIDTIKISAVGYVTNSFLLNEINKKILLKEDIEILNEVLVYPEDYAKELVQNAINSIDVNYPNFDEHHIGFFREITSWTKNRSDPAYVVEATLESHKNSYNKKQLDQTVRLLKKRDYNQHGLDSVFTKIIAGAHHTHRFDVVADKNIFLDNIDRFSFKIEDILKYNDKNLFKLKFRHTKKESPYGYVYIQDQNFAFVKFEVNYKSNFQFSYIGRRRISYSYVTHYFKGEDNLWRFLRSSYQTSFKKGSDTLNLKSEYVTTSYEANSSKIPYLDQFQRGQAILHTEHDYDSNFWQNNNTILPDMEIENLFKEESRKKESRTNSKYKMSKKEKIFKILLNFRFGYAIQWSWLKIDEYDLTYTNPSLEIQHSENTSKDISIGFISSFSYEFRSNIFIGFTTESKITKTGITSYDLSMSKDFNLNPNGRPIKVSPGLRFGYQRLNQFINKYSTDIEYKVKGKSFDSGSTNILLTQKQFHFQPNLMLSIEKSNRLSFFTSISYNLPFDRRTGLTFIEKDEFLFFRKKQFLKDGDESLTINSDGNDILTLDINFNVGILLTF